MRYVLLLVLAVFILASCSKPKEKTKVSREKIEQDSVKSVAEKLGVQVWFPDNFITTYEYQQYLRVNNKLLLPHFIVVDIVDNDSTFVLTIEADYSCAIFIDLFCTKEQIIDILNRLGEGGYELQIDPLYSAVIEITSIRKVKYGIESSIEDNSYESEDGNTYIPSQYVNLSLDVSDSYICKGKLIQLFTNPEY